jgi:Tol biopolymer transport system component
MKAIPLLVFLGTLAVQLFAQATSPASTRRRLTVDDSSRFEDVSDPQVSPDGQWILYTLSVADPAGDKRQTDIWMVKWDGSQPVQLTSSLENESSPRWSPDGKYISFLSSRSGGKAKGNQVWILDRVGGEARQLTELKDRISAYVWSPDSTRLALVATESEEPQADASQTGSSQPPVKPIVITRYHF